MQCCMIDGQENEEEKIQFKARVHPKMKCYYTSTTLHYFFLDTEYLL